jgi:hypothetical protein
MNSPFRFGTAVTGEQFTNREEEIGRLHSNFRNLGNTVIVSPRRIGKTSLIKHAATKFMEEGLDNRIRFCFVDMYKVRDEEEFYGLFASSLIKSTSSRFDEWVQSVKSFLGNLVPRITLGGDPQTEFSLSFDYRGQVKDFEEVFDLPEKLAKKYDVKLIVCLDEFQNLEFFNDPVLFQKRARASWQHHENASYILYGSKNHLMSNLFQNRSMPFYRFGDMMFLDRIEPVHLVDYVVEAFSRTGKEITSDQAFSLVTLMEAHPYFVQQMADILWNRTETSVTDQLLEESQKMLIKQNQPLFQEILENLTNYQLNFIHAMISGETRFSSAAVLNRFRLGSSANIKRIKESLVHKNIIGITEEGIRIEEPAIRILFERYFEINILSD